jgi:hypothetical protein
MPQSTHMHSPDIIIGLVPIGRLFGRSRWTVRRWINTEGFPAAKLPDGQWVTDRELIRRWILARSKPSIQRQE